MAGTEVAPEERKSEVVRGHRRRIALTVPTLLLAVLAAVLPLRRAGAEGAGPETSVTAPAALAVGPHLTSHPVAGFTLSGFDDGTSLLVRITLDSAPDGTTLGLGDPTGLTAPAGVGGWTGQRHLGFRGSAAAVAAALGTLTVTTGTATGDLSIRVEVHPDPGPTAGLVIDPVSGHLYRWVAGDLDWSPAITEAASDGLRFDGVTGHLVTITTAHENAFVRANTPAASRLWLGLTDQTAESVWRWVTGPEGAATGGDGGSGLRLSDTGYANWGADLPDDGGCFLFIFFCTTEDHAVMRASASGTWDDVLADQAVDGIVVEYSTWGGRSFPSLRTATLTTVVARPPRSVTATAGDGSATVTWQAPEFGTPTGFVVTTAPADGSGGDPLPGCTTTGALSCTVTGLTNGVPVTFTVEATFTDEGTATSAPSAAVTPATPPPPDGPEPEPDVPATASAPPGRSPPAPAPPPAPADQPEPGPDPDTQAPEGPADEGPPVAGPDVEQAPAPTAPAPTPVVDTATDERRPPFPTFSALEEPAALVATVTSGLALLGVAGSAGAAAAAAGAAAGAGRTTGGSGGSRGGDARGGRDGGDRDGGGPDDGQEVEREGVSGIDVLALGAVVAGEARGDHSRLWRWPGTARVDRAGVTLLRRTSIPLPLVARVVEDGAALRAMFGSLALILPASGVLLGIASAVDTGGIAMPPSTRLMAIVVLLGLLDAATGLLAFATFTVGVALAGGIVDGDSVRSLLGIGVASFGPGLLAALFRPLRRPPARTPDERWERLTDAAVVSVVGAMSVQLMVGALSGITGYALPVSDAAGPLALAALPVLALRVAIEELTARHFPARLRAVVPDDLPEPPRWRRLLTIVGKAGAFVFVGLALIGPVWQLYVAAVLFVLAPSVGLISDRLPNSPLLWRLLPQGIPGFVALLVIGGVSADLVESWLGATPDYAQMSFVALAVPYTLVALLGLIGREGAEGEERWIRAPERRTLHRIGGIVMLAALIRLHLG